MALHDAIALEIYAGTIPLHFRATDLITPERKVYLSPAGAVERYRVGLDFFAATTLTSQLANLCENTGNSVSNGQMARYRRVAKGVYELLGLNKAQELTAAVEPAAEVPVPIDWQSLSTWAARFAFLPGAGALSDLRSPTPAGVSGPGCARAGGALEQLLLALARGEFCGH